MPAEQVAENVANEENRINAISVVTMIAFAALVFFVLTGSLAPRSFA